MKEKLKSFRELGVICVLIALIILLTLARPVFISPTNFINVVRQTVQIGIMAVGMTFLIISGEMDLSVGSIFGTTGMLAATLYKSNVNPTVAFLVAILVGCAIGLLNGILVTKTKIPAFIATLGTMKIFRSVAYAISGGQSISVFPESVINSWVFKMGGSLGPIPIQIFIMAVIFVVAGIVLAKTETGYNMYATGGNPKAANLVGINTDRVKIMGFIISGAVSALAAMISIAYLGSVPTTAGEGREMDVIAAVILGGASLSGGRGTMLGTFIGAMIISVVKNGMVLLSVPVFWQDGFIGVVLILAVLLDTVMHRKDSRG